MDLFADHSDPLIKYCLTLENEQKQLRQNQVELHQELIDLKNQFQEERSRQGKRLKFVLEQCKIKYDVWQYTKYLESEESVDSSITNLEYDLENLKSKWELETSDDVFPGTRQWCDQHTTDVYDSLTYHKYALKLEARHIKTKYFIEHNRNNPGFDPNQHIVVVSISVNPLTMSMIGEIIPELATLNSDTWMKEPRHWSPNGAEWHRRVIYDLHFDKTLSKRVVLGRPD